MLLTRPKVPRTICFILLTAIGVSLPAPARAQELFVGLGDILQWAVPAAAAGTTLVHSGEYGDGLFDAQGTLMFAQTYAVSIGVTYAMKYGIETRRPNGGKHSFPSGHTASAFAAASFLQERYGWTWGAPAYLAATYTGYSRVANDAHYPRDVLAAAAISMTAAHYFTRRYEGEFVLSPYTTHDSVGLCMSFDF